MDGAPRFFSGSFTLGASGLPSTDRLADCLLVGNAKIQGGLAGPADGGLSPDWHSRIRLKRHHIQLLRQRRARDAVAASVRIAEVFPDFNRLKHSL